MPFFPPDQTIAPFAAPPSSITMNGVPLMPSLWPEVCDITPAKQVAALIDQAIVSLGFTPSAANPPTLFDGSQPGGDWTLMSVTSGTIRPWQYVGDIVSADGKTIVHIDEDVPSLVYRSINFGMGDNNWIVKGYGASAVKVACPAPIVLKITNPEGTGYTCDAFWGTPVPPGV